jgi:hypothetical protein
LKADFTSFDQNSAAKKGDYSTEDFIIVNILSYPDFGLLTKELFK